MAHVQKIKGKIGILTGGGDVPGLNPAIRSLTISAIRDGYEVIGIRRGWAGIVELIRDKEASNEENIIPLTEPLVDKIGRTGGTFLHSSRTRPSHMPGPLVPEHLKAKYSDEVNDLTPEVLENLAWLGVDILVAIGGDDTLSYAVRLYKEGFNTIALPKTMDNDVPGTDYCIGFSTCVSRTIELTHRLRTSAGSHERFLVIEVFGRYAGYTALMPTMAGAANRCLIPEHHFDIDQLCQLMIEDRRKNPSNYSVVLVSEGANFAGKSGMIYSNEETDMFGHKKLGGIGDRVSEALKQVSPKHNNGRKINVINQRLGYMVRSGAPDALDSIVPMAFGNLALGLIRNKAFGRLVNVRHGRYDNVPIDIVTSRQKVVDVHKFYDTNRLRPIYESFESAPLFLMTSDI